MKNLVFSKYPNTNILIEKLFFVAASPKQIHLAKTNKTKYRKIYVQQGVYKIRELYPPPLKIENDIFPLLRHNHFFLLTAHFLDFYLPLLHLLPLNKILP